ncbi:uncharacterized protein LOC114449781 [Parambassis ranga]|uniref:Uncharacterized protein LOC114449781 n=1 Tax=Parambassis ranga TaxID=210632 RepID=A0A6P7K291_9TELE|nr:uncharacterized protein LOC114449781 [Parambassis ranga]
MKVSPASCDPDSFQLLSDSNSSLSVLGCIRAPLLLGFSRGYTTAQNAAPPSCCSVLPLLRAELLSAELRVSVVDSNSSAHKQHPAAHRFLYQSFSLCAGLYYGVFGSGTTLIVTDERVVQPVLSVYPAASSLHPEGSSSLLCLASAMFPPLVRFSWRRQKENGLLEELPPAEGEQLELRESGLSASIRVLDRDALRSHKYSCYVEHEGGRVEAHTQQEVPAPAAPCPPEREPPDLPALQQAALSFQAQCRVRLLLLLYTVLIVKSLLYCCGLCLLMISAFQGPSSTIQGLSSA